MNAKRKFARSLIAVLALLGPALIAPKWTPSADAAAVAAGQLRGEVLGGGPPIANSMVTLWPAVALHGVLMLLLGRAWLATVRVERVK